MSEQEKERFLQLLNEKLQSARDWEAERSITEQEQQETEDDFRELEELLHKFLQRPDTNAQEEK